MRQKSRRPRLLVASEVPYWLNPVSITTSIVFVSLLLFLSIDDSTYLSEFRQARWDYWHVMAIYSYILISVLIGMTFARFFSGPRILMDRDYFSVVVSRYDSLFRIMAISAAILGLFGNILFFVLSGMTLSMLMNVLNSEIGATYVLRDSFEKIAGATSFMNLTCWWFAYAMYVVIVRRDKLSAVGWSVSILLFLLGVFRGFAVNERRVIFELLIPGLIICVLMRRDWSPMMARFFRFAPFIAVASLVFIFVSTEYFRTWANFWGNGNTNLGYFEWALTRLAGYYATALNNGVAILEASTIETYGTLTLSGVSKFPLIGDLIWSQQIKSEIKLSYVDALSLYTNPEFNNPGGFIVTLIDFGIIGGGFICFLVGFAVFFSFRLAQNGNFFAVLLYSQFFFSILEMTRVWNLISPFGVINLIFLSVWYVLWKRLKIYSTV